MESPKNKSELVKLSDEEAVKEIIVSSILKLWELVNNLTRLRPTKQERYRVTIFGSARAEPGSLSYEEVKKIARALALLGCDLATGGGPGLMQAANEGFSEARVSEKSRSIGIAIDLPFEQKTNPFVTQVYEHATFFTRLHHFVLASDAFVIVPGGIGTTLEAMMIWQLLQVGHVKDAPFILVGEMWSDLVEWSRAHFLKSQSPLASPEDLTIPICVKNAEETISILRENYEKWSRKS